MSRSTDIIDIAFLTNFEYASEISSSSIQDLKYLLTLQSTPFLENLSKIISCLCFTRSDELVVDKMFLSAELINNLRSSKDIIINDPNSFPGPCQLGCRSNLYIFPNLKLHLRNFHFFSKEEIDSYIEKNNSDFWFFGKNIEPRKIKYETRNYCDSGKNYIQCFVCLNKIHKYNYSEHASNHLGGNAVYCGKCERYMKRDKYVRHMKIKHGITMQD